MRKSIGNRRAAKGLLPAMALLLAAGSLGCQVDIGGQTLPSPYYQSDDVQYFPPGPEFKLANEAAALKARQAQAALEAGPPPGQEAQRPGWSQPRWR